MKRWLKALLLVLVALVALGLGASYAQRLVLKRELAAYRANLRSRGEKLSIEEIATPPSPAGLWVGSNLIAACKSFERSNYKLRWLPGSVSVRSNNHAICFSILPSLEILKPSLDLEFQARYVSKLAPELDDDSWAALASELSTQAVSFQTIRGLLQTTNIQFSPEQSQSSVLAAMRALEASALLHLHNHELAKAHGDALTSLSMLRCLCGAPSRWTRRAYSPRITWELLQHEGWTEAQLRDLQTALESADLVASERKALEIERAGVPRLFDEGRAEDLRECVCGQCTKKWSERLVFRDWSFRLSYHTEKLALEDYQIRLEALRAFQAGKLATNILDTIAAQYDALRRTFKSPEFDSPFIGYGDSEFRSIVLKEASRRLAITAVALKRFHLREGRYPVNLSELVPSYMSAVLSDPMDQQPLRYRLKEDGGFALYSIGLDGVDNGGVENTRPFPISIKHEGDDIIWPQPASVAEVESWVKPPVGSQPK